MKLVLLACLTATIVCRVASPPAAATAKPDPEFIAKALEQQDTNVGASLQAKYTVESHYRASSTSDVTERSLREVRYVRTRQVLFEQVKDIGCAGCEANITARFDRASRELRRLTESSTSARKRGLIDSDATEAGFTDHPCPDPVMVRLSIGPLFKAIKQGVVADEKEEIDGHLCWRVDIPERPTGVNTATSWSVWVDPDIGFCPRRFRTHFARTEAGKPTAVEITNKSFLDYKSLGDGVFFPMRELVTTGDSTTTGQECRVQEVTLGQTVAPKDVEVVFPSGTQVTVTSCNATYVQP